MKVSFDQMIVKDSHSTWISFRGAGQCFSDELFNNTNVPKSKHASIKAIIAPAQKNLGRYLLRNKAKVVFASDLVGELEEGMRWRRYELYRFTPSFVKVIYRYCWLLPPTG